MYLRVHWPTQREFSGYKLDIEHPEYVLADILLLRGEHDLQLSSAEVHLLIFIIYEYSSPPSSILRPAIPPYPPL